ncbi:hypothetical protein FB567DRAFT_510576 [Paraphoma chrysanthemicola]|uniref:Uncharacterized protein n=1 Tax=Paraphoma chrysanthemicola TaxID=798071 RepID=A0A8K0RFY3_9PLEO|nr:hypothetical protein FB567DRAFT_510576 [Paraphoma chrysanthemicola]
MSAELPDKRVSNPQAHPLPKYQSPLLSQATIMPEQRSWSGCGVILSFFKVRESSKVSEEALYTWFNEEFTPALLATGAVKSATLYKAANPSYDKQQLLLYNVSDLAAIQAGRLSGVARSSKLSLFEGSIDDHVEFEWRIYSFAQLYETAVHSEEVAPTILLAMMQPAQGGEAELDAWYREEHNQQMSEQTGWLRTTRFSLVGQNSSSGQTSGELSFLAIHAFEQSNQLGNEVQALEPMSDWTKKIMSEAQAIDAAIYHKQKEPAKQH